MPPEIFKDLKNTCIARKRLNITRFTGDLEKEAAAARESDFGDRPVRRKPKPKSKAGSNEKAGGKPKKRNKLKSGKKPAKANAANKKAASKRPAR